jgi:hypothetical protein
MLKLTPKQRYVFDQALILAWAASVQRAKLYRAKALREKQVSQAFRSAVLQFVEGQLLSKYESGCAEQEHVENIGRLVRFANKMGKGILGPSGYKFGVAQKLLNVVLKHLWCLGRISEPPHCPVDRIVLDSTSLRGKLNWTQITSAKQYRRAIAAARVTAKADGRSLAEWELKIYSRRSTLAAPLPGLTLRG